jgi:hypothetical protein
VTAGGGGAGGANDPEAGSGGAEDESGATAGAGGDGGSESDTGGTSSGGSVTGGTNGVLGGAGAGGDGGGNGPFCDDSVGELGGCDTIDVDSSCEEMYEFQAGKCEEAEDHFKPRIAEGIQFCIQAQTPVELCDSELTYLCADDVIRSACPDDEEAVDACVELITGACTNLEPDACLVYFSALTDSGKALMTECMNETGLGCDLYTCAEGL